MSKLTVKTIQLNDSNVAAENFAITGLAGVAKISRGNAGATLADVLTIDANNNVAFSGSVTAASLVAASVPGITSGYGVNHIGVAGGLGFGVGIAPSLPAGFSSLYGTNDITSSNYGNYLYSDGSVMVWIPAFYYKYGTGSNGIALNVVDVKAYSAYGSVAAANADGYALHRAFYNAGAVQQGVFVDKYACSNNAGTASSLAGMPFLSSAVRGSLSTATFASLTGAPTNAYHGAIPAAKTRGSRFFCNTRFIRAALALLANAHASASKGTTFNAWYSSAATNFPKGCNNDARGDVNDATLSFVSDGNGTYNSVLTGSANIPAKTAHNGQSSGVMDLNGGVWEINLGFTSNGANFYILNESVDVKNITSGNTLSTDAWGAAGLAAMYTSLGATYQSLTASSTQKTFGAATQVLSAATSGLDWAAAGAGIPLSTGVGGSNQFGNDGLWDYRINECCVISGGSWASAALSGVWALSLASARWDSAHTVGFRSASYL